MLNTSKPESSAHLNCPTTRQNYYFGKLLTAYDLQSEQRYLNEKRWLINRYGIGWGVLCGLNVTLDPHHPCTVRIEPGVALDQYGNEILVCDPQFKNIQTAHEQRHTAGDRQDSGVSRYYLTITYHECAVEPSPIPVGTCEGYETDCAYNRILETFKIDITQTPPKKPRSLREELEALFPCETECLTFLKTPGYVVNQSCLPRQICQPITLACIEFNPATQSIAIDTMTYRKLAFSNELLHSLMQCMLGDIRDLQGAHLDRRRYVPLLANTIKGLEYQDGKIAEIRDEAGIEPFRLTSDGDTIWITDRESPTLIRIDRRTNTVQRDINLDTPSWGIAFDGEAMWISQPQANALTRIRICNGERWTCPFDEIPRCALTETSDTDVVLPLPTRPQELFYHQGLLYVSHALSDANGNDDVSRAARVPYLSIIDTRRCCRLTTVPIPSPAEMQPESPILSMASDGGAIWIVYRAVSNRAERAYAAVRRVQYQASTGEVGVGPVRHLTDASEPGKLTFDGTHLWLTHLNGVSRMRVDAGNEMVSTSRMQKQEGLAYGAGEYMWSSEVRTDEARLNRINIFTVQFNGEVQFIQEAEESATTYNVNDVQFDGAFLYVVGHYEENNTPVRGIIHRILP